jgi:hypothetical protein
VKVSDYLGDIGIEGRMICIKTDTEEKSIRIWTGFFWPG